MHSVAMTMLWPFALLSGYYVDNDYLLPEANVAMARVVMGDSVFGIMAIHYYQAK